MSEAWRHTVSLLVFDLGELLGDAWAVCKRLRSMEPLSAESVRQRIASLPPIYAPYEPLDAVTTVFLRFLWFPPVW